MSGIHRFSDSVTASDILRGLLTRARDTSVLSWRQIALLEEFSPLPPGTLCSIYKGAEIPRCWWKRYNVKNDPRFRPTVEVRDWYEREAIKQLTPAERRARLLADPHYGVLEY